MSVNRSKDKNVPDPAGEGHKEAPATQKVALSGQDHSGVGHTS